MLLTASHINKTFRSGKESFHVLKDVDICVDERECVGLIGTSGSGKSTLANIIIGLEQANSGELDFAGISIDPSISARRRSPQTRNALLNMQMIFQHPVSSFSERMNVGTAVMEGLAYREGFNRVQAEKRMRSVLELVGLPVSYEKKHAWELSGGECQRAAIARAIIGKPKLLICDEPTSALDVTVQAHILALLKNLCEELSMACLFISHDLAVVRGFCCRLYVMDAGKIVEKGSTDQIFANPQSDAAKRLLESLITF